MREMTEAEIKTEAARFNEVDTYAFTQVCVKSYKDVPQGSFPKFGVLNVKASGGIEPVVYKPDGDAGILGTFASIEEMVRAGWIID